jgi:hypothetical protein
MRHFGLARCRTCRRIMLARHLAQGRCRNVDRELEECHVAFWQAEEPLAPPEEVDGDGNSTEG